MCACACVRACVCVWESSLNCLNLMQLYVFTDQKVIFQCWAWKLLRYWPQQQQANDVDSQVSVSEYIEHRVTCAAVVRFTAVAWVSPFRQELSSAFFAAIVSSVDWYFSGVWAREYLVGHGDVVELGSVADDLFCLSNTVVSAQPHHRLRQQPAPSTVQPLSLLIGRRYSLCTNTTTVVLGYI